MFPSPIWVTLLKFSFFFFTAKVLFVLEMGILCCVASSHPFPASPFGLVVVPFDERVSKFANQIYQHFVSRSVICILCMIFFKSLDDRVCLLCYFSGSFIVFFSFTIRPCVSQELAFYMLGSKDFLYRWIQKARFCCK